MRGLTVLTVCVDARIHNHFAFTMTFIPMGIMQAQTTETDSGGYRECTHTDSYSSWCKVMVQYYVKL